MNLFYLRYFVTLAHIQHYTKAAEQLCITQPSLSHAIAQLEKELGLPLFEKNGRKTTLTRFGEGLIRLGLLRPLGIEYVPRLAAAFLKENPDSNIQFTFHTGVTQDLLDGLASKKYDLVFCSQPPAHLNFTAISVQKQDLVLITPKDHPLAPQHTVDLLETLPYPQVYFEKSCGMRSVVDQMFAEIGAEPHIAYETKEDQVIAGLVAQGFGIAIVPYMDLLLKLDLKILQINSPACERSLYLVNNDAVFMPPAVRSFRQFVLNGGDFYGGGEIL